MENKKTETDKLVENYFLQEQLQYQFEPFATSENGKNPDFIFYKNGKKILVENKEIEKIPFDNARPNFVGSFDPRIYFDLLRRRVDTASRQLKPYLDQVDYCVILLGKVQGYTISLDDLFFALYGNPIIRIPINTQTGAPRAKAYSDLTATGSLRKNHPETKQMIPIHDFVSGVGLIKPLNGLRYYEEKVMSPIMSEFAEKQRHLPLETQTEEFLNYYEKMWQKEKQNIPQEYLDPEKIYYKVELIANPLGKKMIGEDIFTGKWDYVRYPQIVSDVQIRIGDLARETGETIHTIRFWTQEGLLETVGETEKGYQLYDSTMIARVNEIRRMQKEERLTIPEMKKKISTKTS